MKHPCKSVTFARSDYEASARDNKGAPISLALDFIYGYASGGRNPVAARGNVFYNVEGRIVYPAGTFGVVYDPRSHTQRFFTDHDAPISYLVMHPNKRYVATAGVASGIPGSARVPMRPSYVLDENLQLCACLQTCAHYVCVWFLTHDPHGRDLPRSKLHPRELVLISSRRSGACLGKVLTLGSLTGQASDPQELA